MTKTIKRRSLLLAGLLPAAAVAHGPQGHRSKPASAPEQQAWGIAGKASRVSRTVHIEMDDRMRFTPDRLQVREGETLRLKLRNSGKMLHELVIGTSDELAKHAELMRKFPNMEHDEPWMSHVAAGKQGELVWLFNRVGEFEFACLIPGHYEAGMRGRISVLPR